MIRKSSLQSPNISSMVLSKERRPMDFRSLIREIPDFPSPGILFRDITPLLADPKALKAVTRLLAKRYENEKIQKVVGIESRGFIFGAPLACELEAGFVPARKPGKLPYQVVQESYDLEYGKASIAIHTDAIRPGEKVLIIDDVIATGGTIAAACNLVRRVGGEIAEVVTIIELTGLQGRRKLGDLPFYSIAQY
jgi:adenine phosphoribosyltransferase